MAEFALEGRRGIDYESHALFCLLYSAIARS